ncbi:MAG: hypothetical protein ACI80V_001987 [Rhodothermales bacterium]|jgi:hypothetical protein
MLARFDPNRAALETVALALGDLLDEMVFLGGAAVGLLVTDPAAPPVRITKDIDCIIEVASRSDYFGRVRDSLVARGFVEMIGEDVPACAWGLGGVRLDVMPTDDSILGFPNPWFEHAIRHADVFDLGKVEIQLVRVPDFIATKMAAFQSRGRGDYLASHDIEDLIAVVDGRPSIVRDVQESELSIRHHVSEILGNLVKDPGFLDAVPGHVIDPGRERIVLDRLKQLARSE